MGSTCTTSSTSETQPQTTPKTPASPPTAAGNGSETGGLLSSQHDEEPGSIATPRIFSLLEKSKCVLIAGCGGGYDVLSGLPLYFALKSQGKKVYLANLSFTDLSRLANEAGCCDMCYKVGAETNVPASSPKVYFPELFLSRWFKKKFGEDVPIYAFIRSIGVHQLSKAYKRIVADHSVDAVVLCDGGTDSLMFGRELQMGTPIEDQTSIAAVSTLNEVPIKLLACLGFGVDSFHGVSHGLFLENVAALEKRGGYLGSFSVSQSSSEGSLYIEAYRAVAECMQPSIVCASITDAMQGHFGNYHSTRRTGNSELFINPLMCLYWCFQLSAVMESIPYAEQLLSTRSAFEVDSVITRYQRSLYPTADIRKPIPLPM